MSFSVIFSNDLFFSLIDLTKLTTLSILCFATLEAFPSNIVETISAKIIFSVLFEFLYTFKNSLEFTSLTIFPLTVLAFLLSVFPVVIKSYNLFSEGALSFTFLEIKFVKFCCFIVSSPSVTSKVESLIISFFCTFSLMLITSDKISFCTSLSDFLLSLNYLINLENYLLNL